MPRVEKGTSLPDRFNRTRGWAFPVMDGRAQGGHYFVLPPGRPATVSLCGGWPARRGTVFYESDSRLPGACGSCRRALARLRAAERQLAALEVA